MKLENQVSSLELSRRLKELGVPQESLFYWCDVITDRRWGKDNLESLKFFDVYDKSIGKARKHNGDEFVFSAFTVSELGEMLNGYCLPYLIYHKPEYISGHWTGKYKERHWHMNYNNKEFDFGICSEADARAKMLIHLIEKGIVRMK